MANYGGALELFRAVSARPDGFVRQGSGLCQMSCQEAKGAAFAYIGLPGLILDLAERRGRDFYSCSLFRT